MPKVIDNVKENILHKAIETFAKADSTEVSIRRIAKECNIGMGTVYNYFPSKQELLKEALKLHISGVLIKIEEEVKQEKIRKSKAEKIYVTLENFFLKTDKKAIRSIASMILSYPLDEAEIIAFEIKNFAKNLEDLVKKELNISDEITVHIIVNTLVFFAHNPEYTFDQAWEKMEKLI